MASLTIRALLKDQDFSKTEGYSVRPYSYKGSITEEQYLHGTRIFRETGGRQYFDLPNFEAKVASLLRPFVEGYSVHARWELTGKPMIVGRYEGVVGVSARATLEVDGDKYNLEAQGGILIVLESVYGSFREGEPSLVLVQRWDGKKIQSIVELETRIAELEKQLGEKDGEVKYRQSLIDLKRKHVEDLEREVDLLKKALSVQAKGYEDRARQTMSAIAREVDRRRSVLEWFSGKAWRDRLRNSMRASRLSEFFPAVRED